MQACAMEINISKILQVAETLESIVCRCFGPDGRQVLFIKSTSELFITKDGRKILECLLLDHPIARMIVNSAFNHFHITGDGVKSFIILLCGILRGLTFNKDLLSSGNTSGCTSYQKQRHLLKRISNLLITFQSEVLEHIVSKHLTQHFLSIFSTTTKKRLLCRASLQSVLDTFFCGRIGYNNCTFLSSLASDFFCKCLPNDECAFEVVDLIDSCFSELYTEIPGLAIDNSRILPGIVLHRDFSVYCTAEGELRALIVSEQIHQSLSAPDVDAVVSSDTHLQLSQSYLRQRTENIIKQLQENQIKLILSCIKQADIVHYFAKQCDISIVDCLPPEELDLVCRITGVSPLSTPLSSDVVFGHVSDTFLVTCCQPIVLGSRKYVHLILNSSLGLQPHCIIVCGPVKGLTEQFISAFHGAFKMLKQLFQPVDGTWEQTRETLDHCKPNQCSSTLEHNISCSKCHKETACCDIALQGIPQAIGMDITDSSRVSVLEDHTIKLNNLPCGGIEGTCLNVDDETLEANSSTAESKDQYRKNPVLCKCFHKRPGATVSVHSMSFLGDGFVLPGGGTFEILLHYYLHQFARKCQDRELAETCSIVGESLLCIPSYIHSSRKGNISFPLFYSQIISAYQTKELIEVPQAGLESVSCKYQLLVSVLHCISKLVTIDFIIGTKRSVGNIRHEESDDDL
ncbi:Bardet-Biedl syndrome 10 [Pelobates cultripes]|uniref:Bardet-Biedl syndrome 10 n=1 Tax=Pelobates cultripes TaxID=61616 RepID=A0AAD1RTN7_PELCU|nr:Bardet-Biedl syndrome 10 [Pelobates cultripes]